MKQQPSGWGAELPVVPGSNQQVAQKLIQPYILPRSIK